MLSRRSLLGAAILPLLPNPAAAQQALQDDIVAAGWQRDVLIRWGDRVEFDSPAFAPSAPTIEGAATQFGWDGKVIGLLTAQPGADGVERALLAVAHPTVSARMAFPGGADRPNLAACMQGASIINVERRDGRLVVADGGFQSRRLTATTLCRLSGPAVARVGDAIQGVLSVSGGAVTPWGSMLLAEGDPQPWFARLRNADDRFPHSAHASAYGWMVEHDPFNPQAVPVKRTALGRFAHAGVAATLAADGRAVVFMTQDSEQGALFRFVSAAPPGSNPDTVLDAGTLSVAVAVADGWNLRFVPLPASSVIDGTVIEAARALGCATFDRPGGLAVGANAMLYLACRGVTRRAETNALNPRANNADGHVLAFRPDNADAGAEMFGGEILLLGGDPKDGNGVNPDGSATFVSRPDGLATDDKGRVWIATEASGLVVAEAGSFALSRVWTPPIGAMTGGVAIAGPSVITAAAHPGATPEASYDRPATRWPNLRPSEPPRTTLVVLAP